MTTGVLGYGSLLHPGEVRAIFGVEEEELVPVRVEGYRRSFRQKSLHREGREGERAILTVHPDPDHWYNAVLAPLDEEDMEYYRQREAGYTVTEVPLGDVEAYEDEEIATENHVGTGSYDELVTAVGDRPLDDPRPIPNYVSLCVEGARHWGDGFLRDFLVTTHRV